MGVEFRVLVQATGVLPHRSRLSMDLTLCTSAPLCWNMFGLDAIVTVRENVNDINRQPIIWTWSILCKLPLFTGSLADMTCRHQAWPVSQTTCCFISTKSHLLIKGQNDEKIVKDLLSSTASSKLQAVFRSKTIIKFFFYYYWEHSRQHYDSQPCTLHTHLFLHQFMISPSRYFGTSVSTFLFAKSSLSVGFAWLDQASRSCLFQRYWPTLCFHWLVILQLVSQFIIR